MSKKKNHPTLDSEYGLFGYILLLTVIGLGFSYGKRKKEELAEVDSTKVLDESSRRNLPLAVNKNGELVIYNRVKKR